MYIKDICKNLMSEFMWNKNCRRQLSDLTYPPCEFKEYDNSTNSDNSNSNYNDNNNDNNSGNTDNKHKNINNGNIRFCNSW